MIGLRTFETFSEDAVDAYREWCADRGQPPVVHEVDADSTATSEQFRAGADAFLARGDRPDAVFCLYERQAVELVATARERGLDVPGDLLVATIAEMGLATSAHPAITTLELTRTGSARSRRRC